MQSACRRWARRVGVGVLLAAVVGTGLTVYLLQRPPAVWTEAQQVLAAVPPERRAEKAEAVIARLTELVEADVPRSGLAIDPDPKRPGLRPDVLGVGGGIDPSEQPIDQTHALVLTNAELVSVASEMFADWADQRGYVVPDAITEPIILVSEGDLAIAFSIQTPGWQQVFSGKVDLAFKPDGMAVGKVDRLTAGSLPISINELGETLRRQMPESESERAEQLGEWLTQLKGFEFRPVLKMDHRRRARVVAVNIGPDELTLTLRVQDHRTYKRHNALLGDGRVAVTDALDTVLLRGEAVTSVPTDSP